MSSKILGAVLRARPLGDNDLILTVLSQQLGKIDCIAKGVRKSKKSSLYAQPFAYSEMTLHKGKHFYTGQTADLKEPFYGLRQSLEALYMGQYLAEVCLCLPQGNETDAAAVLKLLLNSLFLLAKNPEAGEILKIKTVFEVKFAQIAGLFPDVSGCEGCGGENTELWDFSAGFFCENCGQQRTGRKISQTVIKVFRHILTAPQSAAYAFEISPQLLEYISRLTGDYLETALDTKFTAAGWYESLKR